MHVVGALCLLVVAAAGAAIAAPAPALPATCGAAGAVCGKSLPPGSPCGATPGFCQPGLYCSSCKDNSGCSDDRSICRAVPKGCGTKAADPDRPSWPQDPLTNCCPPNAYQPLTANASEWLMPSCKGGLTCKFYTPGPWRTNPNDIYAANYIPSTEFFGTCIDVKPDCGKPGKACCPNPYHTSFNPAPPAFMCWGSKDFSNASYCSYEQKKCVPNAPNCGKVGTPCCVSDGGSTTNSYCMGPTGASPGFFCTKGPVPMCSVCPPDWRTKLNNKSFEYWSCKSN